MKTPSLSRVTLAVVISPNQTAPSGAMAKRPSLTMGVDSGKDWICPSDEMCEIARIGVSVYQAPPAPSAASPSGSRFWGPLGIRSILPFRNTPIASENSMVNQTAPLGPIASAVGMSVLASIGYSLKLGSDRRPRRQTRAPKPAATTTTIGRHTRQRHDRRDIAITVPFTAMFSPLLRL